MKMSELFSFLDVNTDLLSADSEEVLDLTSDTRKVQKGSLFFLLPRAEKNFVDYFQKCQQEPKPIAFLHSCSEQQDKGLYVKNIEEVYFKALKVFYKESVEALKVYGITGTNGKTTTAFMLQNLLEQYGVPTGIYGTIENSFRKNTLSTNLTSPTAEDFYRFNHENFKNGMKAVVCEVSSHALDQKRLSTEFLDGAAFTSFSQDHLDYHKEMNSYWGAKLKIKTEALKSNGRLVLSKDITSSKMQKKDWPSEALQFGKDYEFEILKKTSKGCQMSFSKGSRSITGELPFFGDYNASNFSLALVLLSEHLGEDFFPTESVFEQLPQIPGRMERINFKGASESSVFIDYSHTPDSLEKALQALKESADGKKIFLVFGCGGDRDKGKRPLMGRVAEKYADESWVTNDNPRSEDAELIAQEVIKNLDNGCEKGSFFNIELDRSAAIRAALFKALQTSAMVLIAGKGHEQTQEIKGLKKHFSDKEEVLSFLKENEV